VVPPAAIVSYPDAIDFDQTGARGSDRLTLPVVLVVGRVSLRSARDDLGSFVDGSGARSIKAILESGTYTAFHELRVVNASFDVVRLGGTDYIAALFDIDIFGSGS